MGYAMQGFNGYTPLTFTEIYSYMKAMKIDLSPTEVGILRRMSIAYVNETYDKNPLSNPPYIDDAMVKPKNNTQSIKDKFAVFAK